MSQAMKKAFPVFNGFAPKEGPKGLPVVFDFTVIDSMEFDLLLENTQGEIQFVQSVWIDNFNNPNSLIIDIGITKQRIVCPPRAQVMAPVIGIDQTQIRISSANDPAAIGQCIFLNVPMPYTQVGSVTVTVDTINVTSEPYAAAVSDSGNDVTTNAPIAFLAANPDRRGLIVSADPGNVEEVAITIAGVLLIALAAGQQYQSNAFVPVAAIEASGPNGGAVFSWIEFE